MEDSRRTLFEDAAPGITAFWSWWEAMLPETKRQIATGQASAELVEHMSTRVQAIHPDLAWEVGRGRTSEYALVLTGEGDPQVRLVVERWKQAGPGDDAGWSYHTARQPLSPDALSAVTLEINDVDVSFSETRVAFEQDDARPAINLVVWHPALQALSEQERETAMFVILDNALGEDGLEKWILAAELADEEPADASDLVELARAVEALASETPQEALVVAEGIDPETEMEVLITFNAAVRRWDHPFHDTWCECTIPYDAHPSGLPTSEELEEVRALEEALVALLAESAVHLGSVTGSGMRRVWLFIDGESDAEARLRQWSQDQPRTIEVHVEFDPGWESRPL